MKHNCISVLIKYRHSACYNKYINVFLKFEGVYCVTDMLYELGLPSFLQYCMCVDKLKQSWVARSNCVVVFVPLLI